MMTNEPLDPQVDRELLEMLAEVKQNRKPWYQDTWVIAALSAVGGAVFMYLARQPEVDHFRRLATAKPPVLGQQAPARALKPSTTSDPAAQQKPRDPVQGPPVPGMGKKADAAAPAGQDTQAEPDTPSATAKNAVKPDFSGRADSRPMNPLGGNIGILEDGGLPSAGALPDQLPTGAPATDTLHGLLVTGTGGAGASKSLTAIARSLGGGLKKYEEYAGRGKTSEGYLVWVPEKNSRAFVDRLRAAPGIDISDQQEGSSSGRKHLLTENLEEILARLTKQRTDLLVKYFDDAPQVRDVDDQIEAVKKSMSSMKAPGAGYAIAKIEQG